MKIAFFSNFMDHHTAPLCKELYRLTKGDFTYVELSEMPESYKRSGYPDFSSLPFILPVWKCDSNKEKAIEVCKNADVTIFNGWWLTYEYALIRAKTGGIAFDLSERLLKQGLLNILSPRVVRFLWYYHTLLKKKPFYKLCKGAYVAKDQYQLHSYYDKCFTWAYFTEIPLWDDDMPVNVTGGIKECRIMWCSRFISWKHPELMVNLATRLKAKGYNVKIDMFGSGELLDKTKQLCESKELADIVTFAGNLPNSELMHQMRQHHIFILTSDKQEGWGAVANEAMSNGCVFVGSDEAGSVPCLVKDRINGCVFRANDINSLEESVSWIIEHPEQRKDISKNAYRTMNELWSPSEGALRLIMLIDCLKNGKETPFTTGPCSKQFPIDSN